MKKTVQEGFLVKWPDGQYSGVWTNTPSNLTVFKTRSGAQRNCPEKGRVVKARIVVEE